MFAGEMHEDVQGQVRGGRKGAKTKVCDDGRRLLVCIGGCATVRPQVEQCLESRQCGT